MLLNMQEISGSPKVQAGPDMVAAS